MRFLNCSINEAKRKFKKKIIFFGAGSWLKSIIYSPFILLKDHFAYIIDNKASDALYCNGVKLDIFHPDIIRKETDCIIILTSPVYMYDMYMQLEDMSLPDTIECYAFPFMQLVSDVNNDEEIVHSLTSKNTERIPKTIHSFWFSGDEKPAVYQRCLDSWDEYLSDYQIIEWNQNNYDFKKHPFVCRAIEMGAWAFASDFARLDVLTNYGGIYLDMDVEVFRSFDELLGNSSIIAYSNNFQVDLAVVGSEKNNPLFVDLLRLYDECSLPETKEGFVKFFQPSFVKPILYKRGIRMDGSFQQIDEATVFPKECFMPQDHVLFFPYKKREYTFCNHLDNFGWSFSAKNKREKKIEDNRKLWNLLENGSALTKE